MVWSLNKVTLGVVSNCNDSMQKDNVRYAGVVGSQPLQSC